MIGESFKNVLHIPMFGFGGKTHKFSNESCDLFPLTRNLQNPFVYNDPECLSNDYANCLTNI